MAHEKHPVFHSYDPFNDSVQERLRRMGLLTAEGKPDQDAMAVVSRLYAGLFYDDLYDFYSDISRAINCPISPIWKNKRRDICASTKNAASAP